MALTCGEKFLRIMLVVCNILVFLLGCICTGFSAYTMAKIKDFDADVRTIVILAIVLAVSLLILLLGFVGCCGAWKLNSCLLKTYAIIISILMVIEAIIGILMLGYPDKSKEIVTNFMLTSIDEIQKSANQKAEEAVRNLQENFECCGANGPSDWSTPKNYCCRHGDNSCEPLQRGCADAVYEFLRSKMIAVGVTAIVLSIIEMGAIFAACCLAGNKRV